VSVHRVVPLTVLDPADNLLSHPDHEPLANLVLYALEAFRCPVGRQAVSGGGSGLPDDLVEVVVEHAQHLVVVEPPHEPLHGQAAVGEGLQPGGPPIDEDTPPVLRTAEGAEEERGASWLELFFDLVFVVAIAQLALRALGARAGGRRFDPVARPKGHGKRPFHASHLPELYGLFAIIVLGESLVAVVLGIDGADWGVASAFSAAGGFLVAACLWWIYFDSSFTPSRRVR
jgi:hypothetical protein